MWKSFQARRPWAAASIAFIFSPIIGMSFLNRGRWAAAYLLVLSVGAVTVWLLASKLNWSTQADYTDIFVFGIVLVGVVHAFFLARKRPPGEALRWYARWYGLTTIGVLIIGLELAGRIFLYQSFYLPGASMSPTLNLGDRFWAEKFAYFASNPERGDVVVFDVKGRAFVKRIVGLPGDRIQMQHGKLYLNGAPLPQHRVADFAMDCAKGLCDVHQDAEIMPNGHSYNVFDMVNDGREDNTSVFVVPAENYFVLGDNRDNSDDSRVDLGFVPLSSIRGRATLKYIDARSGKYVWQTIN